MNDEDFRWHEDPIRPGEHRIVDTRTREIEGVGWTRCSCGVTIRRRTKPGTFKQPDVFAPLAEALARHRGTATLAEITESWV